MGNALAQKAKARRRALRQAKREREQLAHQVEELSRLKGVRITSEHGGPQETLQALRIVKLKPPSAFRRFVGRLAFWRRHV